MVGGLNSMGRGAQWELIGTFRQKSKNFSDCSEIENKGQLIIVVRYFNKDLVIF